MTDVFHIFMGIHLTPWKLSALLGALMFAGRWVIQAIATKKNGKVTIPRSYWVISLLGSAMVTPYFISRKNDAVGVLTNLLPASVALYNLIVDIKNGSSGGNA